MVVTRSTDRDPRWCLTASLVLAVALAQGLIGYVQYFTDLPEALVVAHMLGASLLVVSLTHGILALRARSADTESVPVSVSAG